MIGSWVDCPTCNHKFIWTEVFHGGEDFVIYDLETTGLYPESDEFIQIAAMRFRRGRLCPDETFFSYAKPGYSISAFITSYTGITNEHVRKAPRPPEVLEAFTKFVGAATLIAHNAKRFDSKFLEATCRRHRMVSRPVDCIDSIRLSKRLFGSQRGILHNLDTVISRLRIKSGNVVRPDARGDVHLLGLAVEAMHRQLRLDAALNGIERHQSMLPSV